MPAAPAHSLSDTSMCCRGKPETSWISAMRRAAALGERRRDEQGGLTETLRTEPGTDAPRDLNMPARKESLPTQTWSRSPLPARSPTNPAGLATSPLSRAGNAPAGYCYVYRSAPFIRQPSLPHFTTAPLFLSDGPFVLTPLLVPGSRCSESHALGSSTVALGLAASAHEAAET